MTKNYEALNVLIENDDADPFTEERYTQFYRHFPNNTQKVLDIGCNTGRGGKTLKNLNPNLRIHGLDAVKDFLDALPKDIYESGIQVGESNKIPAEDGFYDVVVAGEFIEHLYQADFEQILGEIFRVLKIGGRLLLTTPNPNDIKKNLRGGSVLSRSHVSQHFHDTLALQLRIFGFSRVKLEGSGKVTRYLGKKFPLFIYGSYLAMGDKF